MDWYKKHILSKFASKEILYHGTSPKNLSSIMSQGLIPDPKIRSWSDDPDANSSNLSRQSFEGVYLTNNFMTAKGAASRISLRGEGMIVAVMAETRSLFLDEDSIVYSLQRSLHQIHKGYIMNEWLTEQSYISYMKGELEDKILEAAKDFMNSALHNVPSPGREHVIEQPTNIELVVRIMKALLVRQVAYILKETDSWSRTKFAYELKDNGLSIEDIPSAEVAEVNLRRLIDEATRKLIIKIREIGKDEFNFTARSPKVIGFHGANRILCIMIYTPLDKEKRTYKLTFPYCSDRAVAEKMLTAWNEHVGYKVQIEGLS